MASATTTTRAPPPPPPPQQQPLEPARRSQHVAVDMSQSDGDTWHERIAVCESATVEGKPQLLVRSYYRNARTHERTWDEPPSGASHIKHATEEMRHKADLRMQELQLTLEMIPDDPEMVAAAGAGPDSTRSSSSSSPGSSGSADSKGKKNKKKGLFRRLRSSSSTGSKKEKKYLAPDKDLNLQKAIARSMADQVACASSVDPVVYFDPNNNEAKSHEPVHHHHGNDDEDLAMAKALSMSERQQQPQQQQQHTGMSEEEMLRAALEASRREARAAKPPLPDPGPMHYSPHASPLLERETFKTPAADDDDELDSKMPARAFP